MNEQSYSKELDEKFVLNELEKIWKEQHEQLQREIATMYTIPPYLITRLRQFSVSWPIYEVEKNK